MTDVIERLKIGIIITCFNSVEYTQNAINSIRTSYPFHLIIIDDFSTDGTKQYLYQLGKHFKEGWTMGGTGIWEGFDTIIDTPTDSLGEKWNLGMAAAEKAGCKAAFICNNDILFHPQTIDNVVKRWLAAKQNEERIGIVSAHNMRGQLEPSALVSYIIPENTNEGESPDFSCFLLDISVWKEVGKFDINYIPCYFEDGDFHLTLSAHNYIALNTPSAPYYHFGSITQNSVEGGLCKSPQFEKLREYHRRKWGTVPGEPLYDDATHRRIKLLPKAVI
jgi:GT2 family glycosyltransferase